MCWPPGFNGMEQAVRSSQGAKDCFAKSELM